MDSAKQDRPGRPPSSSRYNTRSSAKYLQAECEAQTSASQKKSSLFKTEMHFSSEHPSKGVMTRMQKRKVDSMEKTENVAIRQSPIAGMIKKAKNDVSCSSQASSVVTSENIVNYTPATSAYEDQNGGLGQCPTSYADSTSNGNVDSFSFHVGHNENTKSFEQKLEADDEDVSCLEILDDDEEEDGSVSLATTYRAERSCYFVSHHSTGFSQQSWHINGGRVTNASLHSKEARMPFSGRGIHRNGAGTITQPISSSSQVCGEYEGEIHDNLRKRELRSTITWGYLETNQKDLGVSHRWIMVNWLAEFAEEFGLQLETLFLGVAILDNCLLKGPPVERSMLQLLGMASMLVAVKFEEAQPPRLLQHCCEIAEKSFTEEQVISMEATVLKTLDYQCAIPTAGTFIWRCLKAANADCRMEKLAEYLISLTLMDYNFLRFRPSKVSASAVFLAGHMLRKEPWSELLEDWTGYRPSDLRETVECLSVLHKKTRESNGPGCLFSIQRKYFKPENYQTACTFPCGSLPDGLFSDEYVKVQP